MGGHENPKQPVREVASNIAGYIRKSAALALIGVAGLGSAAASAEAHESANLSPTALERVVPNAPTENPVADAPECAPPAIGVSDTITNIVGADFVPQINPEIIRYPVSRWPSTASIAAFRAATAAGKVSYLVNAGWSDIASKPKQYAKQIAAEERSYQGAEVELANELNLGSTKGDPKPNRNGMDPDRAARYMILAIRAAIQVDPDVMLIGPTVSPVGEWQKYFKNLYGQIPPKLMKHVKVALNLYPHGTPEERLTQLQEAIQLGHEYGPEVVVTEMDATRQLKNQESKAEITRQATKTVAAEGAKVIIYNKVEDIQNGLLGPISTATSDTVC